MLPKINTILYATALGSGAPYVFRYALSEAQKNDAKIIILHVMEALYPFGQHLVELHMSQGQAEDIQRRAHESAKQKIKERVKRLCEIEAVHAEGGEDLVSEIRVIQGEPHLEIVNQAKATNADLIIVGSHRHTVIGAVMLGHTATRVMHNATIPVLLVRIPDGYHEEGFEKE